jgi:hypothetical protein
LTFTPLETILPPDILMTTLRTIAGSILGAIIGLAILRFIPFTPDLTDWGGRVYPRTYIFPLTIVAVVSYFSGWFAAKLCPVTGRLIGMLVSILIGAVAIGWDTGATVFDPLFHHPAYPIFSDHALLALAILLVAGHLGGLRVEKVHAMAIGKHDSTLKTGINLASE